jgi:hypothetical protein
MGVEVASSAELIDYPGQFAAITLVDWDSGKPNPRYWALRLLHDEIHPGDRLVATTEPDGTVAAQGFLSNAGKKKLLLVNKRDRQFTVNVPGARGGTSQARLRDGRQRRSRSSRATASCWMRSRSPS